VNSEPVPTELPRAASGCLTLEQLIAYTSGKLPLGTRVKLEQHVKNCELCADAVEGMASVSDTSKVAGMLEDLRSDLTTQTQRIQGQRQRSRIFYALGSLVLVGLAATYLWLNNRTDWHGRFLTPFPNTIPVVNIGNCLQQAIAAYEAGQYAAAATLFREYLVQKPDNATANFYAGVAELLNQHPEQAIGFLTKAQENQQNPFAEPARWYLGLAWLEMKNTEIARKIFRKIAAESGAYQHQAKQILLELP